MNVVIIYVTCFVDVWNGGMRCKLCQKQLSQVKVKKNKLLQGV